jgi:hypothetical protein
MMQNIDTENLLIVCATLLLLAVLSSCAVISFDKREKWAQAVKNGADPMAATCALWSTESRADDVICYAIANKR